MGKGDGTYEFVGHRGRVFGWCLVLMDQRRAVLLVEHPL